MRAVRSYTPAPAAPAWDATQAQSSHRATGRCAAAELSSPARQGRAAIGIATAAIAVSVTSCGGDGGGGEVEEVDAASAGGGGARLPTQIILSAAPTENRNDRENDLVQMANFSGQLMQYRDPPDAHKAWRNAEQRAE